MVRVSWEKKLEVWGYLVRGSAISKIPLHASVSEYTVKELKREWESLPVGKLALLPEALRINHPKYLEFTKAEEIPHLRIQSPRVVLFTDAIVVARHVWLEVTAGPRLEAMDCSAWVKVLSSGAFLPLHWRGTPITAEETSAPRTTIHPEKPGQLDVAFALPPTGGTVGPFPNVITSGDVPMYFRGPHGPLWNGQGCLLAQPRALYNPQPDLEAYLTPGDYVIRVRVDCKGGESDSRDFVLRSPASWEGLALTPVPGATHK